MPKLTDTDLVILSAAARRGDRAALPLPKALGIKRRGGHQDARRPAQEGTARRKAHRAQGRRMARKQRRSAHDAGHHRFRLKAIDGESAVQPRKQSDPARSRPKQSRPEPKTAGSRPKGQVRRRPSGRAQSRPCWSIS